MRDRDEHADERRRRVDSQVRSHLDSIRLGAGCDWCITEPAAVVRRSIAGEPEKLCRGCAGGRTLEGAIDRQRRAFKKANPGYVASGW